MALKVEIYQKDIVKPFSPTPESLRNYKLSKLDQRAATHYAHQVLFYNGGSHHHDFDQLKESLSKTLSVLYPLAGRLKDEFTIECNDKGVDFVRANVPNYDLIDLLRLPETDLLLQLFQLDPFPMGFDVSMPMLGVQVNRFRCGGMALAVCIWHGVCDAGAIIGLLHTWAAINRGAAGGTKHLGCVVDSSKVFPPIKFDISAATYSFAVGRKAEPEYCAERFVFSGQEIERMRKELEQKHDRRPTRVQAVSAFIWAGVIRASLQVSQNLKPHILLILMNMRKRLNPAFPSACLGNLVLPCAAEWEANNGTPITPHSLEPIIREAIHKVTEDYVNKMHVEGGYQKVARAQMDKIISDPNSVMAFGISSLCSFPYLETDFGWGNPVWFLPAAFPPFNGAFLFNTTDGGIEAWIALKHQVMSNLVKDDQFLSPVSRTHVLFEPPR